MLSIPQVYVVSAFLLAVGVFVLLACASLVGAASSRLRMRGKDLGIASMALLSVVAFWFGTGVGASIAIPRSFDVLAPFIAVPIVGAVLITWVPPIRTLLTEIPTAPLVALQTYRAAGGVFLYPFLAEGYLTAGFAWPAGVGDVLTGLLALPVGWMAWRQVRGWRWAVVSHALFGIADLIVAPAAAAVYGFAAPDVEPAFPVMSIPLFFGPPLGIVLHLVTLRGLWLRERVDRPYTD
ncbi:MAG: hypothetical protein AAF170_03620 [Bacteroidota bacterium]